MKKASKAALLSAFAFPGVGHIYLKNYIVGFLLVGVSIAAGYYLTANVVEQALAISDKIQSGDVPLDAVSISELVSQQSIKADGQLLNIATFTLLICWLVGIVDSYRIGYVQDKNEKVVDNK